jgi:hypothetical protein
MNRKDTELAILKKMKEIRELALAYSPEDEYLSMYFIGGHVGLANGVHPVKVLDCWEELGDGKGPYHPGLEEGDDA